MVSVGSSKNGSMRAESASGMSSMSEASMPFQPAIDEPSNAWPSLNFDSLNIFAGTVTCCSLPLVSVKRRSTNLTSFSLIVLKTSPAAIKKSPELKGCARDEGERTVRGGARDEAMQEQVPCHAGIDESPEETMA